MPVRDACAGSQSLVEAWARRLALRPDAPAAVMRAPHLSTARFDFYVVGQPALGPAGDLFVLCDGQRVLAVGSDAFGAFLRCEAYLENPQSITPALFGNLFARIALGQRLSVIEQADDFALGKLPPAARAAFQPPRAQTAEGAIVVLFWTSGPAPFDVRAWEVRVTPDYAVRHSVRPVEP